MTKLLSEEKIEEIIFQVDIKFCANKPPTESKKRMIIRAIEAAVLEAQAGQEPVAWRVFDGEGGYDLIGYADNEDYRDKFIERNPEPMYATWVEPLYAAPVVQPGYKLLKDSTHDERSWSEDSSHENGAYFCLCHHCGRQFTGYKRRVTCKVCAAVIAAAEGKP